MENIILLALLVIVCAGILSAKSRVMSGKMSHLFRSLTIQPPRELTYDDLYPIPPVNQRIRTNTMVLRPDWRWTTKTYPQYIFPRGGGNRCPTC
jgi:hypothetical protein